MRLAAVTQPRLQWQSPVQPHASSTGRTLGHTGLLQGGNARDTFWRGSLEGDLLLGRAVPGLLCLPARTQYCPPWNCTWVHARPAGTSTAGAASAGRHTGQATSPDTASSAPAVLLQATGAGSWGLDACPAVCVETTTSSRTACNAPGRQQACGRRAEADRGPMCRRTAGGDLPWTRCRALDRDTRKASCSAQEAVRSVAWAATCCHLPDGALGEAGWRSTALGGQAGAMCPLQHALCCGSCQDAVEVLWRSCRLKHWTSAATDALGRTHSATSRTASSVKVRSTPSVASRATCCFSMLCCGSVRIL